VVVVVVVLVVAAVLLEREESASGVTGVEVGEPHPARAAAHTTARNVGAAPRRGFKGARCGQAPPPTSAT
jgi:hypothetical protein